LIPVAIEMSEGGGNEPGMIPENARTESAIEILIQSQLERTIKSGPLRRCGDGAHHSLSLFEQGFRDAGRERVA